jgi:hypothetical protein
MLALYVAGGTYEKTMKQREAVAATRERYELARGFPAGSSDELCSAGAANVDRREMLKLVLLERVVGVGSAAKLVALSERMVLL